jgi:hypothetical protein
MYMNTIINLTKKFKSFLKFILQIVLATIEKSFLLLWRHIEFYLACFETNNRKNNGNFITSIQFDYKIIILFCLIRRNTS